MYKNIFRMLPVAALIALAACQGGAPAGNTAAIADSLKVDSLSADVMNIHDEAMAKMMVIRRLKTRMAEISDSLGHDTKVSNPYIAAEFRLDSANRAMENWMQGYDMHLENKTTAEKKAYLESEKKKIEEVKTFMLETIDQAKKLLKEE
ncbi:hypothetical protein EGT74_11365 [Chitinophaga lutea]|uniref:Viral A-type inclusion protein n=1 Tax=Chitinophaga lutea TaxID=2488634 RepID=A0A3N4Q3B8_9BACT|nr:hypothetical protein [Chitinophaga lutea]RPE14075.1 hypothetical protein EGT74_11365 [Chitinophaga lutea]